MERDAVNDETGRPAGDAPSLPSRPSPPSAAQRRQSRPLAAQRFDPHTAVNLDAQMARRNRSHLTGLRDVATLTEQQQLATSILRRYGAMALTEPGQEVRPGVTLSASALKNFAVAWGIASDKLTILQGRPTEILRVEESESQRPAILALVRKLANLREAEAAGPDASL
jgi:hypothetical protein